MVVMNEVGLDPELDRLCAINEIHTKAGRSVPSHHSSDCTQLKQ